MINVCVRGRPELSTRLLKDAFLSLHSDALMCQVHQGALYEFVEDPRDEA